MKLKKILVWFRNDLRLHDNEMLVEAIAKSDCILPVYFFDPRHFELTKYGTAKSGYVRIQFLLESVAALRKSFQELNGDLLIINGKPEDFLPSLVEQHEITEVYHHREVAAEETLISTNVEDLLWKQRINLKHFIGHTLYNKEDLPFPIKDIPDVFTQFKKKTERDAIVKACFLTPSQINFADNSEWGELPKIEEIGLFIDKALVNGDRYALGGEKEGLVHLNSLLNDGSAIYIKNNSKTADKPGFSSRLSAWLALGCLSPRMVYWLVKGAESKFDTNPNFNQIILGLLWRDYFRFMFKKHGSNYVKGTDIDEDVLRDHLQDPALASWKNGSTGHGEVDRYMKQVNSSGFLPNAARLKVATFLIYILKINWTIGAAYFEEKLIDHAFASNWGNWAIVAEGGKDVRSKNTFDLEKQMKLLEVQVPAAV
jgi:deoxyribodipyrimidine photo-lyase